MPGKIVNHFRILLAQKATKQQKNIALMDVQRETGIAWSMLNSWSNIQLTLYDATVIIALCEYFDCQKNLLWVNLVIINPIVLHASAMHAHRDGSLYTYSFLLD
jgi:lipoprotein signal peptidase